MNINYENQAFVLMEIFILLSLIITIENWRIVIK